MPLSKHYGGRGAQVMRDMRQRYGEDAERVFYATENKQKSMKDQVGRARRAHSVARKVKG